MPSATSYSPRSFVCSNSMPELNIRPSIVFGWAVNSAGSMVNRVSSTNNVMRFSVGPMMAGSIHNAVDVDGDCAQFCVETNEQFGLDTKMELLVLGNGERRACCNCDFDDNRTLFLLLDERMEKKENGK